MRQGEKGKIVSGGGSVTKPKPMGDVMGKAEKEDMMSGGGRGSNDNANNGCCRGGGATLGRGRGGNLGQSGTKKDDDVSTMAVWRGNNNQ